MSTAARMRQTDRDRERARVGWRATAAQFGWSHTSYTLDSGSTQRAAAIFFVVPFIRKGVINFVVVACNITHTSTLGCVCVHFLIILGKSGFLPASSAHFLEIYTKTWERVHVHFSSPFFSPIRVRLRLSFCCCVLGFNSFSCEIEIISTTKRIKCNWGVRIIGLSRCTLGAGP